MKTQLDAIIGRVTMYRQVTLSLAALVVISLAFSLTGQIAYTPTALLASLATILVLTIAGGLLFAMIFRTSAHLESSVITALLLFFILAPTSDPTTLTQVGLAAIFASASKYVLAVRGRHIFNPAAVGALWLAILHFYLAYWWIGSPIMLPFTAVLALLVLYRTKRVPLAAVFVVIAAVILLSRSFSSGSDVGAALKFAFGQTPLVFFAGFMLTEPLTLPPTRWQQLTVAAVVGVLFSVPITIGSFTVGPESALIVGNALAFAFGQRRGIDLVLTAKRRLTPSSVEFSFTPTSPLRFRPGQYLELALPHRGVDSRGSRRVFSIASAPGETVRVAMKMPATKASSFKQAMEKLPIGSNIRATGVSGDFVLRRGVTEKILLVAGGIGVTPFISQLTALPPEHGRDIVLVYAAGDPLEVGYQDELAAAGIRSLILTSDSPSAYPGGLEALVAPRLTREVLEQAVPDVADRHVYVSGPPGLVDHMSQVARSLKAKSITKDYFSGY